MFILSDVLRNAVAWLCIPEDTTEGNSSARLYSNNGLPAPTTDGFGGMQTNQVDDGRSWWCW